MTQSSKACLRGLLAGVRSSQDTKERERERIAREIEADEKARSGGHAHAQGQGQSYSRLQVGHRDRCGASPQGQECVPSQTFFVFPQSLNSLCVGWRSEGDQQHAPARTIVMQLRKVCSAPDPVRRATHAQQAVDESLVDASGKMMVLERLLDELFARGHKVLVFSQFVSMLESFEVRPSLPNPYGSLYSFEYDFGGRTGRASVRAGRLCRIDGSTGPLQRREEMDRFQRGGNAPDAPRLFLLSTRAGGLGINLTAADTVVFYDQDWVRGSLLRKSYIVDDDGFSRTRKWICRRRIVPHRIGQTKPVLIFRLVSRHTIESKILQRASEKRQLEALVIAKGTPCSPPSSN